VARIGISIPVTEVLNPKTWRDNYVWGHVTAQAFEIAADTSAEDLLKIMREMAGRLPDATVLWHIRVALADLAAKLDIPLNISIVKARPVDDGLIQGTHYDRVADRLPYIREAASNYYRVDIGQPIISVERVRAFWYDDLVLDIGPDTDSARTIRIVDRKSGQIHLLPGFGYEGWPIVLSETSPLAFSAFLWYFNNYKQINTVPDVWAVDYTTGPIDEEGAVNQIDLPLVDWVYCVAGQKLLSISGAAQAGGLASTSVSIDGVSQSTSLTASAIYGLNSALEKMLETAEKRIDWKWWSIRKRGVQVGIY